MPKFSTVVKILVMAAAAIQFAAAPADAAKLLDPPMIKYSAGKVTNEEGSDLYFAALHPGFNIGRRISVVLDLNLYVDNEFKLRDSGNDTVVLGAADYRGDRLNIHYGEIENLTLGSGFVVSNYRLDVKSNVPVNRAKGLEVDIKSPRSAIKVFGTRTHLVGVRAVRNMGMITVGTTAVSDSEPDFEEFAVDVLYTLTPGELSVYGELAKITDYGDGFSLGLLATPADWADFKVELRDFDSDFAPGIVDEHYEAVTVVDRMKTNSTGRLFGVYTGLDLFRGHKNFATLTYEDYEGSKPRTTFYAEGKPSKKFRFDLFYANQNFVPQTGGAVSGENVVRAHTYFNIGRHLELILDYYDAFNDDLTPLESLTVKTMFRLK